MLMVSPCAGAGEVLDAAVAVALEVDDDPTPALGAAARHDHVRPLQNPLVAGVAGVVDEAALSARAGPMGPYRSMGAPTELPHSVHEPS